MSAAGRSRADYAAERLIAAAERLGRIWRGLSSDRRLAAGAACGLFVSLFLPWYQETVIARGLTSLRSVSASLTGWAAFSWVEAAVLLVAAGVLALLVMRAEGRALHVPGGDGGVITAAGACTCVLIIWRMFDKQATTAQGQIQTTSGIDWGIFVALAAAGLLAYAGSRIRRAHESEPPLPGEPAPAPVGARGASRGPVPEMDADVTWTLRPSGRSAKRGEGGSDAGPGSGVATRPESGAAIGPESGPGAAAESQPLSGPTNLPEPRRRVRPRSMAAGLDLEDIHNLGISDPPTSPLRRAEPATAADSQRIGGSQAATERIGGPHAATERISGSEADTERVGGSEAATERLGGSEPDTQRIGGPEPDTQRTDGPEADTQRLGWQRPPGPGALTDQQADADDQLTLRLERGE